MSGGAFEYRQNQIDWIIEGIEDHLESMGKEKGDVNDPYMRDFYSKYPEARIYPVESEAVQERMIHAIRALRIAKVYAQRVDRYISGDDGEESFLKRLNEELKEEDMQQNKHTCGFCVEPSEKAKQKEVMYDGTLLRRSLLNQMHSFAIEVQKGDMEGSEFAKFAKKSIERLFEEEKAKQKEALIELTQMGDYELTKDDIQELLDEHDNND